MTPDNRFYRRYRALQARRVTVSATGLTLWVTMALMLAYNATYWRKGFDIFSGHVPQLLTFNLAVYFLTVAGFALFSFRPIVRPFLAAMLMLTAATSFYMDSLGVVIDREMVQNIVTTTFTESKHLFTFDYLRHLGLYGVLPALGIFTVRLRRQRPLAALGAPVALSVLSFAVACGLLMTHFKTYASVLRERKDYMTSYQPGGPIVGALRYADMITKSKNATLMPVGTDAAKGASYGGQRKPVLAIIVAGETARSQNFSLNGYGVPTNPELAQRGVVSFSDVSSCGTATAVSLPCMFSRYTRDSYSYGKGISTETLLDVFAHAGFAVEWWDNNTGDKGIAARLPTRSFTNSDNAEFCPTGECDDGIFMQHLEAFVPTITRDTVLVLHQIGSHGPTYYLRYPQGFEKFGPACRTAEFVNCTPQEITNSYDNTIAYTDHILARTIDFLAAQQNLDTSLLYVSDHGESLGEAGLYLHGAPYFMAPAEQTKVPMILWMSDAFEERFGIGRDCLSRSAGAALSHDNLFHSALGMLDVTTEAHDPALDIFSGCRSAQEVADNG